MPPNQIPEFVMSLLHSSVVHQVALATFQQQQQQLSSSSCSLTRPASPNVTGSDKEQASKQSSGSGSSTPSPLICATPEKATEFYHRLESLGFTIGLRAAERLLASAPILSAATTTTSSGAVGDRQQDDAINLVRTVLWPALFGKDLARENDPASQQQQHPGGGKESLVFKLIDIDFSWTRSVGLAADSPSLADPFIRAAQYDILEDASSFAAGINNSNRQQQSQQLSTTGRQQHSKQQQQQQAAVAATSTAPQRLVNGPNDYVVLLTGMILGFLSSLGFGSHAERRVFGGDRATISSSSQNVPPPPPQQQHQQQQQQQQLNSSVASSIPTPRAAGLLDSKGSASNNSAVVSRAPSSFVTVRHRLLPRDGEPFRPSGMQLKLVVHFT